MTIVTLKRIVYALWIIAVLTVIITIIVNPSFFSVDNLVDFIKRFENQLMIVYVVISLLRGIFLIPSTPFVLAGIALFPDSPVFVITVSMIGILFTTVLLYYFSDLLGFSEKLQKKFPGKMEKWEQRLRSKHAVWIVTAWSFFPLVPTDLMCYVAGIVKMPIRYLLIGITIGEIVLVSCYVYMGVGLLEWIMQ